MISTKKLSLVTILFISLNTFAGLKDVYKYRWLDPKKEVFVLQDKIHENEGRFFISAGFGDHKLSEFQNVTMLNGTLGYYFSEEWAIEAFYHHYMSSENGAYNAVFRQTSLNTSGGQSNIVLPHVVRWDNMMGANVLYTPFYGKINTFNLIFYVDLGFGLGASWNKYSHNTKAATNNLSDTYETDSTVSFNWKFQFKWHLTDNIKIKLDFINYLATIPSLDFNNVATSSTSSSHTETTEFVRSYDIIGSIGFMF